MLLRKYWIPLSVFIVAIVGVGLYYLQTRPPKDPVVIYKPVEPLPKSTEQPTAEVPVGDTSQGGHRHADGTWHNGEKTTQPAEKKLTHTEIMELPLEQQKQIFNSFYTQHGLKPPPRGYGYLWKEPGIPLLDENGEPILHKRGEPIVEITMQKAFTPTLEEYNMLESLRIEAGWQKHQGNIAEAEKLRAEHDQLYEKVQRVRPAGGSILWVAPKSVKERDPQKGQRMLKEKLRAALIEQGYSYLIPILQERGEL